MGDHKTSGLGKLSELYELPMSEKSSWGFPKDPVAGIRMPGESDEDFGKRLNVGDDDWTAWEIDRGDALEWVSLNKSEKPKSDAKEFWDELDGR